MARPRILAGGGPAYYIGKRRRVKGQKLDYFTAEEGAAVIATPDAMRQASNG